MELIHDTELVDSNEKPNGILMVKRNQKFTE